MIAEKRSRTSDLPITNRLLYQLSYLGMTANILLANFLLFPL